MPKPIEVRAESPADIGAVRRVVMAAFATAAHRSGTEAAIVDALREAGALTLSLVAMQGSNRVGHAAFSPVTIAGESGRWFGLGPISVRPDRQRAGIGRMLIEQGLDQLRGMGARGCVVAGDPAYYRRFGFAASPELRFGDVPFRFVQALPFVGAAPSGEITYHPSFGL